MRRDEVERGREAYARRAWKESYEQLSQADREASLAPGDLELLAAAAYMLGRDDEQAAALERAHVGHLDAGEVARAIRCAFWLTLHLLLRRQHARASGWLGRAQRLLDRQEAETVEDGYVRLAAGHHRLIADDLEAGYAAAVDTATVAERFGDADLLALAVMDQGLALVHLGRVEEGLARLDEAMVEVTTGELSPIVTGLVYCGALEGCHEMQELRRAQEWTTALAHWCNEQPDLVPFTGTCLVHRAEIKQLHGAWPEALEEAGRAAERFALRMNHAAAGEARYRQGELLRLQGRLTEAERAFRDASKHGWEPQPGLALLRLAQGRRGAAAASIRRAVGAAAPGSQRSRLLSACVEIMLACGEPAEARDAAAELEQIADGHPSPLLRARAAHARGAVELTRQDPGRALTALREAWQLWQELDIPYESARVRVLVGQACGALGDEEAARLELEAARGAFLELGAVPDLERIDARARDARRNGSYGLTRRELQVLRLVAAGESNKAIASELTLSTRTVDRHVSNIFGKLHVSSRAAATAFAYEHELVQ